MSASLAGISQAFGQFLVWTAHTAREGGAKQVCFLSREGVWLAARYEAMRAQACCPDDFPPARHLAVSRRSTYLAGFEAIEPDVLKPVLAQYRTASMRAVLTGLGLTEQDFQSAAIKIPGFAVLLQEPWRQDGSSAALLHAGPLAELLEMRRATQRDYLLRYLAQQDMLSDAEGPSFLADIGWRGSIQDNLGRLLPTRPLTGLYFHLQPFLTVQQSQLTKIAFLAPAQHHVLRRLRFGAPLEFLVCGNAPTVSGYTAYADGRVSAVLDKEELIPRGQQAAFARFQAEMADTMQNITVSTVPSPAKALEQTLAFLEHPPPAVAALYLASKRDERFGTGRIYTPDVLLGWRQILAALPDRKKRRAFIYKLAESGWPWAILQRDLPLVARFIRFLLLSADLIARKRSS